MVVSTEKCPPTSPTCASCIISCLSCSREHRRITSSNPNLYKDPLISVKGVALMVNILFLFSESVLVLSLLVVIRQFLLAPLEMLLL